MSLPGALSVSADFLRSVGGATGRAVALLCVVASAAACATSETALEVMAGYQPCLPEEVHSGGPERCEVGSNVLLAMASGREVAPHEVVEQGTLEEQRGGFIMAGGMKVDFGFQFQTLVNGLPQLTSVLSYNEIIASGVSLPSLNSITVNNGGSGSTEIIHAGGATGIGATIVNSQDGVNINNISTLSIDIIGLGRVHRGGRPLSGGRAMSMELRQSIIRGLQ